MLDQILSIFAIGQVILTTFRAGSRALYLLRDGHIGTMDGPLILPPTRNESTVLWDTTCAFRHGVQLALDTQQFPHHQKVRHASIDSMLPSSQAYYSLSPFRDITRRLEECETALLNDTRVETLDARNTSEHVLEHHSLVEDPCALNKQQSMNWRSWNVPQLMVSAIRYYGQSIIRRRNKKRGLVQENVDPKSDPNLDIYTLLMTTCQWENTLVDSNKDSVDTDKTENMISSRSAKVTAFAPDLFAYLRNLFGITEQSFRKSILESGPFVSFASNSKGAARTGGFFFFTRDGAYLIKTIKSDEARTLLELLPRYSNFMQENGKRSLLTRFCGLYRIEMDNNEAEPDSRFLLVMNSVFPTDAAKFLTERFDLKGSTAGREVQPDERERQGPYAILKDLDLAREVELVKKVRKGGRLQSATYGLNIGPSAKAALLTQLERDVKLLVDCNVIDYSLLVGVCKLRYVEDTLSRFVGKKPIVFSQTDAAHNQHNAFNRVFTLGMNGIRTFLAPPLLKAWTLGQRVIAWPLSFYGSGDCVVDGGPLSHIKGKRNGNDAIYYFGLIDFLQPFNLKKYLEYRARGLLLDPDSFSCIPSAAYAERFLKVLNDYIV